MTSQQKVGNIDASVVTANISRDELANIVGKLTLSDVYTSAKIVAGSTGIEPNTYITPAEAKMFRINRLIIYRQTYHFHYLLKIRTLGNFITIRTRIPKYLAKFPRDFDQVLDSNALRIPAAPGFISIGET